MLLHLIDKPPHCRTVLENHLGDRRRADAGISIDKKQRGDLACALGDIEAFELLVEIAGHGDVDAADVQAQGILKHIDVDVLNGGRAILGRCRHGTKLAKATKIDARNPSRKGISLTSTEMDRLDFQRYETSDSGQMQLIFLTQV